MHIILGQRKLRGQNEIVGARQHNNREKEVGNAILDAPAPIVVFGPADAWAGVKDRLTELAIKPRKGAVLAMELMITTSPEWWSHEPIAQAAKRQAFEEKVREYLDDRFVPEAIISVTWHLDETTPHLHIITVPVRLRVDGRCTDRHPRWSLSARADTVPKGTDYATAWRGGMGGKGHMAYEQTRIAEIMAPLRLVRGKERSGVKNKPNRVYQAEMAQAITQANAERERFEAKRVELEGKVELTERRAAMLALQEHELSRRVEWAKDRELDCVEREQAIAERSRELAAKEAQLASERQAFEAEAARRLAELEAQAQRIAAASAELDDRRRKAAEWIKAAKTREVRIKAAEAKVVADQRLLDDRLEATRKIKLTLGEVQCELALLEGHSDPAVRNALRMLRETSSMVVHQTASDYVLAAALGRTGMGRA